MVINHRPISLTPILMKIFERVIRKQVNQFLTEWGYLNSSQHGFREGRSCMSGLLSVYDDLMLMFTESSCSVDMIYLDFSKAFDKVDHGVLLQAPNNTAYKRWSCHSGLKLLCKLCRTSPPPAMGARFTVFWACRPCGPAGWLVLLLTKAGDVETNPGPTTLNKKVWICDICHKQIHVRKQISIRCNRIEHWVHLRCAGIRQAQYTDTCPTLPLSPGDW